MSEPDIMSLRLLNRAAVHEHGLECSKVCRNGKFTRVGEPFQEEVQADLESMVRGFEALCRTSLHDPVDIGALKFTTGVMDEKIIHFINRAIGRLIQNKVQRQTTGCTLTSTR